MQKGTVAAGGAGAGGRDGYADDGRTGGAKKIKVPQPPTKGAAGAAWARAGGRPPRERTDGVTAHPNAGQGGGGAGWKAPIRGPKTLEKEVLQLGPATVSAAPPRSPPPPPPRVKSCILAVTTS